MVGIRPTVLRIGSPPARRKRKDNGSWRGFPLPDPWHQNAPATTSWWAPSDLPIRCQACRDPRCSSPQIGQKEPQTLSSTTRHWQCHARHGGDFPPKGSAPALHMNNGGRPCLSCPTHVDTHNRSESDSFVVVQSCLTLLIPQGQFRKARAASCLLKSSECKSLCSLLFCCFTVDADL